MYCQFAANILPWEKCLLQAIFTYTSMAKWKLASHIVSNLLQTLPQTCFKYCWNMLQLCFKLSASKIRTLLKPTSTLLQTFHKHASNIVQTCCTHCHKLAACSKDYSIYTQRNVFIHNTHAFLSLWLNLLIIKHIVYNTRKQGKIPIKVYCW